MSRREGTLLNNTVGFPFAFLPIVVMLSRVMCWKIVLTFTMEWGRMKAAWWFGRRKYILECRFRQGYLKNALVATGVGMPRLTAFIVIMQLSLSPESEGSDWSIETNTARVLEFQQQIKQEDAPRRKSVTSAMATTPSFESRQCRRY